MRGDCETMMVMVSNQTNVHFGWLSGRHPGMIGHLYSPGATRGPHSFFPYSLDNGAWPAFKRNIDWDELAWRHHLGWAIAQGQRPLWAVVPDVVADRDRTLERWGQFAPIVRAAGIRPAFALQDGMTFDDVPDDECMLFMGGSTSWKLAAIDPWCAEFPGRVHVARVNDGERLWKCHRAGAVSVDGTGWWHATTTKKKGQPSQLEELIDYCERADERKAA